MTGAANIDTLTMVKDEAAVVAGMLQSAADHLRRVNVNSPNATFIATSKDPKVIEVLELVGQAENILAACSEVTRGVSQETGRVIDELLNPVSPIPIAATPTPIAGPPPDAKVTPIVDGWPLGILTPEEQGVYDHWTHLLRTYDPGNAETYIRQLDANLARDYPGTFGRAISLQMFAVNVQPLVPVETDVQRKRRLAVEWAVNTANDPDVGYSQPRRQGGVEDTGKTRYYDCSSFAYYALCAAGVLDPGKYPFTSATIPHHPQARKVSWDEIQPGDVIDLPGSHAMLYIGDSQVAHARGQGHAWENQVMIDSTADERYRAKGATVYRFIEG